MKSDVQTAFRLPKDMHTALQKAADKAGRGISEEIRIRLGHSLKVIAAIRLEHVAHYVCDTKPPS